MSGSWYIVIQAALLSSSKRVLVQAKLTASGWPPETIQAMRFLYASDKEAQAARSLNPVRWITQAVEQWQLPTFGYFFDKALSFNTETRVDQVCQICPHFPVTLLRLTAPNCTMYNSLYNCSFTPPRI